jgi:tetratricopeptide (TPR) repeat protein
MSEKFSPDDLMKTMISISASGISTFYSPFQNFLVNPQYLIPKGPVYEVNKNNFFESPIPSYPEEFKKLNDPYFQKRMGLVYSLLGTYFDRTGSNKKAIEALKISQNFMPENYYVNMNMGKLLIKDGDSDEAMKMFERASELCGKSVYPMLWMALTLSQKGNDAGALKILEKAQKRNDQNAEIYYFQGILKWKNRDLVAASKLFRKVLNINSDHVRAMNALAVICIGMKEYSKAEQELNRVLAAKKSSMETDYNFLALYRLQKNMEKVREFEQKIKIGGHPVPKEEDVDGLMPPPVFELDYTEYSEQ